MVVELTRDRARRIAVRAQLLTEPRPSSIADVVDHLGLVQMDLTDAVAPSPDIVLWSRLGRAYDRMDLEPLLTSRALVEIDGFLRPAADVALFTGAMREWPGRPPRKQWQDDIAEWVRANDACRIAIVDRLRSEGPLRAQDLPDTCAVPWRSTGWTGGKSVGKLLTFMQQRGEVAVSSRDGRERVWDLAERVYPDDDPWPVPDAEAERDRRRLRALGIARPRAAVTPTEPNHVGEAGVPATVTGTRGAWRVDEQYLAGDGRDRVALLSPFDRLLVDRRRLTELFDFDYALEMYKPAARRRWGYYALPILVGHDLVGKLDATADPAAGFLSVDALHLDVPVDGDVIVRVWAEIRALADMLGLAVDDCRERS